MVVSIFGIVWGLLGGVLGWCWMRGTNLLRDKVVVPSGLGKRHILKGFLGGFASNAHGYLVPYYNGAYFGKVARFELATLQPGLQKWRACRYTVPVAPGASGTKC